MYSEVTKAKYRFKDSRVKHSDALEFLFEQNQQLITLINELIAASEKQHDMLILKPIEDDLKGVI